MCTNSSKKIGLSLWPGESKDNKIMMKNNELCRNAWGVIFARIRAPKSAKTTTLCCLFIWLESIAGMWAWCCLNATKKIFLTVITWLFNYIYNKACELLWSGAIAQYPLHIFYLASFFYWMCRLGFLVFKQCYCATCIITGMLISFMWITHFYNTHSSCRDGSLHPFYSPVCTWSECDRKSPRSIAPSATSSSPCCTGVLSGLPQKVLYTACSLMASAHFCPYN